jgi:hypothetical protein
MATHRDLQRRAEREVQSEQMLRAAERIRVRGPGGFAGLDEASAAAVSELLEEIAGGWRDKPAAPRIWEAATRAAHQALQPDRDPAPSFPGPAPAGHTNPYIRRGLLDG